MSLGESRSCRESFRSFVSQTTKGCGSGPHVGQSLLFQHVFIQDYLGGQCGTRLSDQYIISTGCRHFPLATIMFMLYKWSLKCLKVSAWYRTISREYHEYYMTVVFQLYHIWMLHEYYMHFLYHPWYHNCWWKEWAAETCRLISHSGDPDECECEKEWPRGLWDLIGVGKDIVICIYTFTYAYTKPY